MTSINKLILVGRLGTHPELRHTASGRSMCILSLATYRSFQDKDNAWKEKVSWHRVVVWGSLCDQCMKHLSKGRFVYIEGRLEQRSYVNKTGTKQYQVEIIAENILFFDRRAEPSPSKVGSSLSREAEMEIQPVLSTHDACDTMRMTRS